MSDPKFRNAGICGLCWEEIESTYRHDFNQCGCSNLFVDGGKDYQRYGYDTQRENGTSVLWSNVHKCWQTLKELEVSYEEQEKERIAGKKSRGRKLMLPK